MMVGTFDRPDYEDAERVALVQHVPGEAMRILDVGCNRGGFGRAVKARRVAEVWGVEPDPDSAAAALQHLDHVIVDLFDERNSIPDGYFDLVTFNDSLEHMVDPAAALRLAMMKLRPSGRIHCCVPNMRQIDNLEHLILEQDWRYEAQGIRDRTHLRFFTKKSLVRLFEEAGFSVLQVIGINEVWWEREKWVRRLFFRMFPTLTYDMRFVQFLIIASPQACSDRPVLQ